MNKKNINPKKKTNYRQFGMLEVKTNFDGCQTTV